MNVPVVPVLTTQSLEEDVPPPMPMVPGLLSDEEGDGDEHDKQRDLERQQAFQAAPFLWQGQPLAPFAIDREGDWLVHRAVINAPELTVVLSQSSAFQADAVRILWFCSHEPEVWLCGPQGLELEVAIRKWGVSNIPAGEQIAATNLALKIYNRAHDTIAVAKPDPKTDKLAGN